jgi:ribosome-binding factor A
MQQILLEELQSLFRDDVADPALHGVVINAVVLSVDYRHLRVHCTCGNEGALRGLERATPFVRRRLSETVELKRVPDLRFVIDAPAAEGT